MVAMIGAVAAALILGLMAAGGPGYARMEKRDLTRIADLNVLYDYLQCPKVEPPLPQNLGEDRQCPEGIPDGAVSDPKTNAPYIYRRIDDIRFEICATFELPADAHKNASLNRPLKFEGQVGCMSGFVLSK